LALVRPGTPRHWKAGLAVRTRETPHPHITPHQVREGLAAVRTLSGLRGRLDVLQQSPLVVADVAHNAEGLAHALRWMREHDLTHLTVALGWMRDKDFTPVGDALRSADAQVFPVHIDSARAWPTDILLEHLRAAQVSVSNGSGTAQDGALWFAANAQPNDGLLITGSHQVVAQLQPSRFSK